MGADLTTGAGTCAGKKALFTRTLVCKYTTMRVLTPTQGH